MLDLESVLTDIIFLWGLIEPPKNEPAYNMKPDLCSSRQQSAQNVPVMLNRASTGNPIMQRETYRILQPDRKTHTPLFLLAEAKRERSTRGGLADFMENDEEKHPGYRGIENRLFQGRRYECDATVWLVERGGRVW